MKGKQRSFVLRRSPRSWKKLFVLHAVCSCCMHFFCGVDLASWSWARYGSGKEQRCTPRASERCSAACLMTKHDKTMPKRQNIYASYAFCSICDSLRNSLRDSLCFEFQAALSSPDCETAGAGQRLGHHGHRILAMRDHASPPRNMGKPTMANSHPAAFQTNKASNNI